MIDLTLLIIGLVFATIASTILYLLTKALKTALIIGIIIWLVTTFGPKIASLKI